MVALSPIPNDESPFAAAAAQTAVGSKAQPRGCDAVLELKHTLPTVQETPEPVSWRHELVQ